jgi:hypothetical protein
VRSFELAEKEPVSDLPAFNLGAHRLRQVVSIHSDGFGGSARGVRDLSRTASTNNIDGNASLTVRAETRYIVGKEQIGRNNQSLVPFEPSSLAAFPLVTR